MRERPQKDTAKWDGFKVRLTETCDDDAPRILTDVTTTPATVSDDHMMKTVHARLAERDALPGEHWVDGGYVNAAALTAARREHGVDLNGPAQTNTASQAAGTYGPDAFTIDFDQRQATCPNGVTSGGWKHGKSQQGLPVIRIGCRKSDCQPCPALRECISSPTGVRRELTVRHRDDHQAVRQARARQQTDEWKERYKIRAGIEGTVSQAVHAHGLRRSRYRGLARTSLQHQLTGAAIKLTRIDAWLTNTPRARTRSSHLEALRPA